MTKRPKHRRLAGALAAVLLAGAIGPNAPPFPPARSVVPFVPGPGSHCYWEVHDRSEKWKRGGIVPGDEVPVVQFVDHTFDSWNDNKDHQIEISVGDPAGRLPASAWAGRGEAEMPGSIGFDLNADLRKLIGGATSLQVWKDGKPVYNAALAGTPTTAELDACVGAPRDPNLDDEE
jgi:hypothetical protein